MLRFIHCLKLRDQIRLIFIFMLAMILAILMTFIQLVSNVSRNINKEKLENTTRQLAAGVENHWQTLENQANILAYNTNILAFVQSETPGRRYLNFKKVLDFINSIEATNFNIDNFLYINDDILCIANTYFTDYSLLTQLHIADCIQKGMNTTTEAFYYRLETGGRVYYTVVSSSYFDDYLQKPLMMVMFINKKPLINMIQNLNSERSLYLLVDENDEIIASSRAVNDSDKAYIRSADETADKNSNKKIYYEADVPYLGWKVIGISDISLRDSGEKRSINWILLISLCMTVLITLFIWLISRNVVNPIISITRFVQNIGHDYTTKRLQINKTNEIGIMANEINSMLGNIYRLNENMTRAQQNLYMAEISKRQVQIAALQSQINPHFLYNTLDCIRGIALKENVRSIADIVSSVSKIFRYSIKAADYVYVLDEINCIRDYMVIIGIRHKNRFTVSFEIEEKLLGLCIPKMILQPIVENAVFHGLEPKKGQGTIIISAYQKEYRTIFSIRDDGVGIDEKQLALLRSSLDENTVSGTVLEEKKSIGILNIYQRLVQTYGNDFSMRINSEPGIGTEVQIELHYLTDSPPPIPVCQPKCL